MKYEPSIRKRVDVCVALIEANADYKLRNKVTYNVCMCGGVGVVLCNHRQSWTLSPPFKKKKNTANRGRPRSLNISRECYSTYLCIWGGVLYGRSNNKSTVWKLLSGLSTFG